MDFNGDLIDIPAKITNIVNQNGQNPNNELSDTNWILTRRFFLFDSLSGLPEKTGTEWPVGTPVVIRYPKQMTMKISLIEEHEREEMIYLPYLEITYRERTKTYIEERPLSEVSFATEYRLDTQRFWNSAYAMLIVFIIVLILIMMVKMYKSCNRQGISKSNDDACQYIFLKTIVAIIDVFSTLFFWFCVLLTGYWFVFFKLQERVYCFLPGLDTYLENYKSFDFMIGFVYGAKVVYMLYQVYFEQSSIDIFFIDWERPKFIDHPEAKLKRPGKVESGKRPTKQFI